MAKGKAAKTKKTTPKKAGTPVRQVELPTYKSFRLAKKIAHPAPKIKPARRIAKQSWQHLRKYWKVFAGILLCYLLLNIVLVRGLASGGDIVETKDIVTELFEGAFGSVLTNLSLVLVVATSSGGEVSEVAGVYQSLLLLLFSLAIVWTLRQTHAGNKVTTKQAFYQGMYPLVPFTLVFFVIGLQLLPAAAGMTVVGIVQGNGLAVTGAEQALWYIFLAMTCLLSVYMIASSLFALFIVTLADMTPLRALRSARQLVLHRCWTVLWRLLFLPLLFIVVTIAVLLPVIYWAPVLAEWVFFVLSGMMVIYGYAYSYNLYRELL